ncbi:MAG: 4-hydroxy-tetrahydrodipicolinate synthase [Bdellovibrionales bacterium]|nr:4-hydroxy-tetrahydrodipicolinate synthase [Bdellovibrionales bacterium]
MKHKTFSGVTTALITPFLNQKWDKKSFLKLLNFQIKQGIKSFVLASTTGENPTLEDHEIKEICKSFHDFKETLNLDLKLILATGSFSTKQSINKTKKAIDLGADAVLVVTPYYNKPPQKGLILHFEKIAKVSSLPLILYNVPARTACDLTLSSIKTLSQIDNIIGIKEATGDISFLKLLKKELPEDFLLLSGDDLSCVEFFSNGGHGAISAGANILAKELIEVFQEKTSQKAKLFKRYQVFLEDLFKETNPIGVKQILHSYSLIQSPELREPLVFCKNPELEKSFQKLNKNMEI